MIGSLPKTVTVDGKKIKIRTDFRVVLNIFEALNDTELDEEDTINVILESMLVDEYDKSIDLNELFAQFYAFFDGCETYRESTNEEEKEAPRLIDWKKDEALIFAEINKVAGCEVRALPYLHWWTFLGYFNAMGEGLYMQVISIRKKLATGKKLEKWEQEFLKERKDMIIIRTQEEEEEIRETKNFLKELFKE